MTRRIMAAWILALIAVQPAPAQSVLDMGAARVELDAQGGVTALHHADGTVWPGGGRAFMRLVTSEGPVLPHALAVEGDQLNVTFANDEKVAMRISRGQGFAVLRVVDWKPAARVQRLELARLSVPNGSTIHPILNAAIGQGHALAVMPCEVNVESWSRAPEASETGNGEAVTTMLGAQVGRSHGLEPAAVGIVTCAEADLWKVMPEFEAAANLPSPRLGGVWGKRSAAVKQSYLFLTSFRESQIEEALAMARRGGFKMVLLGQESWCRSTGHYEIKTENMPDGIVSLKRVAQRFRDAGIAFGLHVLAASIDANDPYLVPVPDPRLVKGASATLAEDLAPDATTLRTVAPPADFPAEDGGYMGRGSILQIGDELIQYGSRAVEGATGFNACVRGYYGTKPAPHPKGSVARHLVRSYGYHLFDMDTTLIDEVASNLARVANACHADMLYFDGSEALQGDHWYYNARLQKAIVDRLDNQNILIQGSSYSPYSWHLISRMASADGHGDLKGYLDERSPGFDFLAGEGMPLDIGWYYGYDPNATLDEYEYVLTTTIGYNSSMSFQVSLDAARAQAFTPAILDRIRTFEALRLGGKVADPGRFRIDAALGGHREDKDREALWSKRKEWRLADDGTFERVVYGPWRMIAGDANALTFAMPEAGRAGFWVQLQRGPWTAPGAAYTDDHALIVDPLDGANPIGGLATLDGVTQTVRVEADQTPNGRPCTVFEASSTRPSADGWTVAGHDLNPPIDLSAYPALGLWLRGDARGASFKVQLLDTAGKAMDFYIPNDYEGWRYQQLERPATDTIDWHAVKRLNYYYNGLPAQSKLSCAVAGLKGLDRVDRPSVTDPYVELGGQRMLWKGQLFETEYLAVDPSGQAVIYKPATEPRPAGRVATLAVPVGSIDAKAGLGAQVGGSVRMRLTGAIAPPAPR